jgi:hypothetical protein
LLKLCEEVCVLNRNKRFKPFKWQLHPNLGSNYKTQNINLKLITSKT